MKIYDYTNIKKLYIVGDIHGDFKPFFNVIKKGLRINNEEEKEIDKSNPNYLLLSIKHLKTYQSDYYNDSIIIVCGDCGFGFNKFQYYNDILTKQNELFNKTNTHLIFMRGNHDDPSYFNNELINMSNIKTVQDYSVIKTMENNILCVGGAISVDRIWRKQQEIRINKYSKNYFKKLFWEDENVIINDNILEELRNNNIKISSVITHTAPSFCMPKTKDSSIGWLKVDPSLKDDLEKERGSMDWLYNELIKEHKLNFWAYGHFHIDHSELINNIAFIACPDNLFIQSPIEKIKHLKINEELSNGKKKRKRKQNIDSVEYNSDLLNEFEALIYHRTNDNVENNNNNNNNNRDILEPLEGFAEIEEAPF